MPLDPHEARADLLTDRECGLVFGGLLGAARSNLLFRDLPTEAFQEAVQLACQSFPALMRGRAGDVKALFATQRAAARGDPRVTAIAALLNGAAAGLARVASVEAIQSALTWWTTRIGSIPA